MDEETYREFLTNKEILSMRSKILDPKKGLYLFWNDDEIIFSIRTGKCDYKKCGNACCKFLCFPGSHEYYEGFGDRGISVDHIIFKKRCKYLSKNGVCQKWDKEDFPRACKQFPHPTDNTYLEVIEKCSFKFKILHSVKRTSREKFEVCREEMIRCFKETFND